MSMIRLLRVTSMRRGGHGVSQMRAAQAMPQPTAGVVRFVGRCDRGVTPTALTPPQHRRESLAGGALCGAFALSATARFELGVGLTAIAYLSSPQADTRCSVVAPDPTRPRQFRVSGLRGGSVSAAAGTGRATGRQMQLGR